MAYNASVMMDGTETGRTENKATPAAQVFEEAVGVLRQAGFLSAEISVEARAWLEMLVAAYLPDPENVAELPERVRTIFWYDAAAALAQREIQEVVARERARPVIREFAYLILAGAAPDEARFEEMLSSIRAKTHCTGRDLKLPIRIVLTGQFRGPELRKLPPLIEEGNRLDLPRPIKSCRERVLEFCGALG